MRLAPSDFETLQHVIFADDHLHAKATHRRRGFNQRVLLGWQK